MFKFNKNFFGLQNYNFSLFGKSDLEINNSLDVICDLNFSSGSQDEQKENIIQVAMKHSNGVFFFPEILPLFVVLSEKQGQINDYWEKWNQFPFSSKENLKEYQISRTFLFKILSLVNIFQFYEPKNHNLETENLYFYCTTDQGTFILAEFSFQYDFQVTIKSTNENYIGFFKSMIISLLDTIWKPENHHLFHSFHKQIYTFLLCSKVNQKFWRLPKFVIYEIFKRLILQ